MKLKLLNGSVQTVQLRPVAGAYDNSEQHLVVHVQGDGIVGTLEIPANELRFFGRVPDEAKEAANRG